MSVTRRLILLVAAVLLPAMLAAAWALTQGYRAQRTAAEDNLLDLARALAAAVERELAQRIGLLQTLAASPALQRSDLRGFFEHARQIAPTVERTLVLSDPRGAQLLNTRLPYGSGNLPRVSRLPDLRKKLGLAPEAALVSDLYFAPVGKQHSFAVQVPVVRAGKVTYYLAMGSFAATLQKLVEDPRLRPGWNVSIADRSGTVIARRVDAERFVGRRATADFVERLRRSPEDLFETVRLDGVATLTAYTPIGDSGWTLSIGMPRAELDAALARAATATVAVTLALFLAALAVALLVGRSIIRPLRRDLERRIDAAVSESRRAQEALMQGQKLEALGRLTGAIAHDFNNLLQTISVSMEVIERRASDAPTLAAAQAGGRAVQNAVKLTRQLTTFGRGQASVQETIDLRDEMLRLQDIVARALRADIALELDLAGDLAPITADVVQLELALLNAALNARDAMPKGGRFRITARNARLAAGAEPALPAGDYVELELSDTGEGIAPELLARVFEPFFTTKDVGKGSGLGLAQIYAFATNSGGAARIASTLGRGTTLTLLLPRANGAPSRAADGSRPAAAVAAAGHGVLLVEDDALVRAAVGPALQHAGFRIIAAADVEEALALLVRPQAGIDIVFSDIVMPGGRNGIDLAMEVQRLRPELPVVLATGYADTAAAPRGVRVLTKPYRMEELQDALLEALRARPR